MMVKKESDPNDNAPDILILHGKQDAVDCREILNRFHSSHCSWNMSRKRGGGDRAPLQETQTSAS